MDNGHDTDIYETILNREKYSAQECIKDDNVDTFLYCQNKYFNFFTSRTIDELKDMLTIIPKGSLIFHGTPIKTTNLYPSNNSYFNNTKISGIQHILSEETIQKTIGTIKFKMKTDVNAELDNKKKREISEKYEQEITKYRERVNDAASKGIYVGKSFIWANTTIDANVMVDVRLMQSMTIFIVKRDIILLNYFKIFKIMENDMPDHIQKYVTHLINGHQLSEYDSEVLFQIKEEEINNITGYLNNKNQLLTYIKENIPGLYTTVWFIFFPIYKRAIGMPKYITQDTDVKDNKDNNGDDDAVGRWTQEITSDGIKLSLRNKYKDTIGDSTYIQLLNYLLGFKGNYRISGYADYDYSDKTDSDILKGTNICGSFGNGINVCKEIMLLDPSKYLTYLGYSDINQFDPKSYDNLANLNLAKIDLWEKISNKLNNLVKIGISSESFTQIKWTTDKKDFDPVMFGENGIYENITIFPHYRFNNLLISQIDAIVSQIEYIENIENTENKENKENKENIVSINDRKISHTVLGSVRSSPSQIGGGDDINSTEMKYLLANIKSLPPNSSGHVYNPDVYESLFKFMEKMNTDVILPEEKEFNNITDIMRDQQKYKIKTDISDVITKTLHKNKEIHDLCINELKIICTTVQHDIDNRSHQIQNMYNVLHDFKVDLKEEPIFFFYLKGSSAIDLVISQESYLNIINKSSDLSNLKKESDLANSDFDINVCINPRIMEDSDNNMRNTIKNMVIAYFSSLLENTRNNMVNQIFNMKKVHEIFASVNKTLLHQVHKVEKDTSIKVNVGDMYYVFEKYEKDDYITNNQKTSIENSPTGVVKVSHIEISTGKLNNFFLLRLKLAGFSGKQYINCHGELFDISIINDKDEADFTWSHRNNIQKINGIFTNDLTGLYMDLNNTLLSRVILQFGNKNAKRLKRLEFVYKLICATTSNEDKFFTQIRDAVHDKLPKDLFCSSKNNIKNIMMSIHTHLNTNKPIYDIEPLEDINDVPIPKPLLDISQVISSKIRLEQFNVLGIINEALDLKAKGQHISNRVTSQSFAKVPSNSNRSNASDMLINTIKNLEIIKTDKTNNSNTLSRLRNMLASINRYESTDITELINSLVSLKTTSTIKDRYNLMYLLFMLTYGQVDINNKVLNIQNMQKTNDYSKLRSYYNKFANMIGIVGGKVINMLKKYDNDLISTRYLNQPINIISSFYDKNLKNGHKIQSIINTKFFKDDLANIIKFTLNLEHVPNVFQKISNTNESRIEGWGDDFIKITNSYFVVYKKFNVHLFNYQIILNTTSQNSMPYSNIWHNETSRYHKGGKQQPDINQSISSLPPRNTIHDTNPLKKPQINNHSRSPIKLNNTHPIKVIHNQVQVTIPIIDVDFKDYYEPTVQDKGDALSIFFPLDIPENMYDTVRMILLGDFLSNIPDILNDTDSPEYFDNVSTIKGGMINKTKIITNYIQNYANNKKAYTSLCDMHYYTIFTE